MEQQPSRRDPLDETEEFDLVGFVLGALEPEEHARVAEAVQRSPELQDAVDQLYVSLPKSEETWRSERPPAGLARRVCEKVVEFDRTREWMAKVEPASPVASQRLRPSKSSWSWRDMVVLAGTCLAVSLILLPSILNSRYQARIAMCQNNLRQVSTALQHYSQSHQGLLPSGDPSGPLGVAGAFGTLLKDAELIEDRVLLCPSSPWSGRKEFSIPSPAEVAQAEGPRLAQLQRKMGGTYAYTMGYYDQKGWHAPESSHRPYVMVLADTNDPANSQYSTRHGSRGQNVLFEDGHTAFLQDCSAHLLGDDDSIYVNRFGLVAAGVDSLDTVLGPSFARPVSFTNPMR
jgi:hypothetical protein